MKHHGFLPYALAAFLIGIVGGFSTVLGPAFVQELNLPYSHTTWTALAQAISTAALSPIFGRMGDCLGRRRTLVCGMVVFTMGNALSSLAGSFFVMLAARFLVGVGTAAMAPAIVSYIVTQFPPERTASGFSQYMLISSISVVLGPTLGGLLVEHQGWRVMMLVCTAICVVVLSVCLFLTRGQHDEFRPMAGFDIPGAILGFFFFGLLLCLPAVGQTAGWRSGALFVVALGALGCLAGLAAVEQKATTPLFSWPFLRRRTFVLSVLSLFLTQGLMQANMTNLIVFVQSTMPRQTVISSYAISVLYLGMSLGAILLGPLGDRHEPKNVLTVSLLVTGAGCAWMLAFSASTSVGLIMASLGLLGFGLGGNGTIFLKVALWGLSREDAGANTGTYGLFRDLAAPFGVAVFVPLFTNRLSAATAQGIPQAQAAVSSIHALALGELICVALGLAAVRALPPLYRKGRNP